MLLMWRGLKFFFFELRETREDFIIFDHFFIVFYRLDFYFNLKMAAEKETELRNASREGKVDIVNKLLDEGVAQTADEVQ